MPYFKAEFIFVNIQSLLNSPKSFSSPVDNELEKARIGEKRWVR